MLNTRELCIQTMEEFQRFGHRSGFRAGFLYGGQNAETAAAKLSRGCDILCSTPGRLVDFILSGIVCLHGCKIFVVDEVDQMMKKTEDECMATADTTCLMIHKHMLHKKAMMK